MREAREETKKFKLQRKLDLDKIKLEKAEALGFGEADNAAIIEVFRQGSL